MSLIKMISASSPAATPHSSTASPYQSTIVQPLDAAGLALVKGTREFVETNLPTAVEASRKKFQELKRYAEEGHWYIYICFILDDYNESDRSAVIFNRSMGFAGLLSAFFVGFVNVADIFSNLVALAPVKMILNVYLILFSVIVVILEYKKLLIAEKYVRVIAKDAHFLTQPYGRGYFYIFIGVIQLSLAPSEVAAFFAGAFSITVGAIIVSINSKTHADLKALKSDKYTQEDIREKFKVADVNGTGKLGTGELAVLCNSLGKQIPC